MSAKKSFLILSILSSIFLISSIGGTAEAKALYAGGSDPNVVYRYLGGTSWETVSQELGGAVLCLCEYDGHLYAGTEAIPGVIGRVWRYEGGTDWTMVGDNLDDQICSLIVFRGNLYAGTAWDRGRLYRYDGGTTWTMVVDYTSWSGFRSLYVWNDILYIGDIGYDKFGHYDGATFTFDDDLGGSCIWDYEVYDSNLYASAYQGRVHRSSDGQVWTTIRGSQNYDSWELETFQGYLYVTTGPKLERYDESNFSLIWTEPNEYEIISMINAGDSLILGTGKEAGYYGGSGIGRVYAYDGSTIHLISGDMGSGIQSLLAVGVGDCWVELTKVDNINDGNCVGPGDDVNYTICYSYHGDINYCPDIYDVNIIDYLPAEVDYNSSDPCGAYDSNLHTVIWEIGTLKPGDAHCIKLKVNVKPCVQPCITITNECKIRSGGITWDTAYEHTPVCHNYLVVEDFNSYANGNALKAVWKVSGSAIEINNTIVRSGKSMKYQYTNGSPPYYTEADANTTGPNSLQVTQDWTTADIESLVLHFYGNVANAAEKMYVALRDTDNNLAVVYYDDPNDLKEPEWHKWNIKLSDFSNINDVNLSSIAKVYIGFGNRESPSVDGNGTVYFDDIRLYPTSDGDLDNDCDVDFNDVRIMAGDWLETGSIRKGSDGNLMGGASWLLDVDGGDGKNRGWCVSLDGTNDFVNIDDSDFFNFRNKTIVFWVKVMNYPLNPVYMFYFHSADHNPCDEDNPYRIQFLTRDAASRRIRGRFVNTYTVDHVLGLDVWNLLAFVIEDTPDGLCQAKFYGYNPFNYDPQVGTLVDTITGQPRHSGGAAGVNLGSENDGSGNFVNAVFDDFRVYDYNLTQAEFDNLAGLGGVAPDNNKMLLHYTFGDPNDGNTPVNSSTYEFYHPLTSVAELYAGEAQGSRVINFRDFAILADNWLEERRWP